MCSLLIVVLSSRIFAWSSFPLDGTKLALSPSANGEFKKWRGQRPRQHHKSMIWLAEWGKIIVLHVRHSFCCKFLTQSGKWRREISIFEVLATTRAHSSKSFILCFCMKTIRAKQATVQFAYFVQREQLGIIAKHLTFRKVLFYVTSSLQKPS